MSTRQVGTAQTPLTPTDATLNRLQHVLRVGYAHNAQLKSTGGVLLYGVAGSGATVVADLRKSVASGNGRDFAPPPGPDLLTLRTQEFAQVFEGITVSRLEKWRDSVKEDEQFKVEAKVWLLDARDPKDVAFIKKHWELLERLRTDVQGKMLEERRAFVHGPFMEHLKTNNKLDSLMHDHGTWDEPSRVWSVGFWGQEEIRETVEREFARLDKVVDYVIDQIEHQQPPPA